jgi:hypothetical protein
MSYFVQLSQDWLKSPGYQNWQVATGFSIGVVSAALCLLVVLTIGVTKQLFSRLRMRLAHNKFLKEVLPPTIGGVIVGECLSMYITFTLLFILLITINRCCQLGLTCNCWQWQPYFCVDYKVWCWQSSF